MTVPHRTSLNLPDDLPLEPEALARVDGGRLTPLIDALVARLQHWEATNAKTRLDQSPPRLGLFGGLGQGKSTVILAVLHRLQALRSRKSHVREWIFGPAVVRFDVSYFKADDLEWRFLTAVLWRRIVFNALWMLPMLSLLTTVAFGLLTIGLEWDLYKWLQLDGGTAFRWLWGASAAHWSWLLPVCCVIAAGASRTAKAYGKVNSASGLFVSQRDLLTQALARIFVAMPSVVLVDDLDRARVEQQRAFLRAMMRFSDRMGFALVVSLDETELLTSAANPESPQELLRKTIHHEYRVPDRGPEDVALLSALTVENVAQRNQAAFPELARQLRDPMFVADWLRVLLLLPPPVSPRLVKRLLADTLVAASLQTHRDWRHIVALLRLQALYLLAPNLRSDPRALCGVLEANRLAGFVTYLEKCHPGDMERPRRSVATMLFARTRMMEPLHGEGWFELVMGMPAKQSRSDASEVLAPKTTEFLKSWNLAQAGRTVCSNHVVPILRLFSESIQHAASGYQEPLFAWTHEPSHPSRFGTAFPEVVTLIPWGRSPQDSWDFAVAELPQGWVCPKDVVTNRSTPLEAAAVWLCWVGALVAADSAARDRIYRASDFWVASRVPSEHGILFDRALLRERCADEELWSQMQPSERAILMAQASFHPDLVTLLALEAKDIALAVKYLPKTTHDERALARWLQPLALGLAESDTLNLCAALSATLPPPSAIARVASDLVTVWPPVAPTSSHPDAWAHVLTTHLALWSMLSQVQPMVPHTLRFAFDRAWPILSVEQRLRLFGVIARREGELDPIGMIGRLSAWIKVLSVHTANSSLFGSEGGVLTYGAWIEEMTPEDRLSGFLCHLLQHGILDIESLRFLGGDGRALLRLHAVELLDDGPVKVSLQRVKSTVDFWVVLLRNWAIESDIDTDESSDSLYTRIRTTLERRSDANRIFDALGWPASLPAY